MSAIWIYVEGGGDSQETRRAIRLGFSRFLDPLCQLARQRRLDWNVVACGPRRAAFRAFQIALRRQPDAFNVLFVDSEAPVVGPPWDHLGRGPDGWQNPGCSDDHCHLIVQAVEAWLVADPDALARYYGQGFRGNVLPRRKDVEAIPKAELIPALEQATRETSKGRYHKIRHCSKLLERLDPARVRSRASHCDRLFTTLEAKLRA